MITDNKMIQIEVIITLPLIRKCQMTNDSDHNEVSIDVQDDAHNLPNYPIDNIQFEMNEKDTLEGWIYEDIDSGSCGPFLSSLSTIIDLTDPVSELFFYQLFDERMWTIISDAITMLDPKPTHLKETSSLTLQIHTTEGTVD